MAPQLPLYFFVAIALLASLAATNDCHDKNLSIVGGHDVFIEDVPYMVALYDTFRNDIICGGSIIHERFILTAAHCFVNNTDTPKRALVGSDRLSTGGVFIDVEQILCHKEFLYLSLIHDICLVKLKDPIEFGCKAALAELPDEDFQLDLGTLVNVTGWGYTHVDVKDDVLPNKLKQVSVPVVSEQCCAQVYGPSNTPIICAGFQGHDACEGDSGGPLTFGNVQVGVVSYGDCALYLGGYTKVASYLDWIHDNINDNL